MAEESPFASFIPSTEVPPETAAPKKNSKADRKARKKTAKALPPVTEAPAPSKQPRKTRTAKAPKKLRAIKIDLSLAMTALAGLQEADAKFVMGVVQAMQPFAKKQRARIVAALSKVFT